MYGIDDHIGVDHRDDPIDDMDDIDFPLMHACYSYVKFSCYSQAIMMPRRCDLFDDDVASDDVASDDVASDDVVSDDVASDYVASHDVASDDVASDDVASSFEALLRLP